MRKLLCVSVIRMECSGRLVFEIFVPFIATLIFRNRHTSLSCESFLPASRIPGVLSYMSETNGPGERLQCFDFIVCEFQSITTLLFYVFPKL